VKWVIAQTRFLEILDKVEPLRNEVKSLEDQAEDTKKQVATMLGIVRDLEARIAKYKEGALSSSARPKRSKLKWSGSNPKSSEA